MTKADLRKIAGAPSSEESRTVQYRSIKPLIVEAIQVSGPADVPHPGGTLRAAAGDWLVLDPQGNLRVCNDSYFRANYSPLGSLRPLKEFREHTPHGGC